MTKLETVKKNKKIVDYSKHPHYDDVVNKMRKVLGAASAFIPEACEALRVDWYAELSQKQVKHDDEARTDIRNQIFNDWSRERNVTQGVWGDRAVQISLPDWLRNPNKQTQDFLEKVSEQGGKATKALYAKLSHRDSLIQEQKPAIDKLADRLPEPIEIPEDEDEEKITYGPGQETETKRHVLPDPTKLYEDGIKHAAKLWEALTGKDDLTAADTIDVLIDKIKPSREYRLRLFKGLDPMMANHYQRVLIWLNKLIQDTLKECLETNKERSDITK
jgi:hypothetical protein